MRSLILLAALILQSSGATTYDVTVNLDRVSTGTATFSIDPTGKVAGEMRIEAPNIVEAKLSGVVKDGTWEFEFPFTMPVEGCHGIATGTAKVPADRNFISGSLKISGDCTPEPMSGTFTFSKRSVAH